ncbi:MAG: DMT family transporter [Pseudomonadota bacterium]|nr:DMT family transporter [Pseudomonadota bacterium]
MSSEQQSQNITMPINTGSSVLHAVSTRFIALVLIWSMTPLAVVWSVRELHPVWALSFRFCCAVPLAWLVLRSLGLRLRWDVRALRSYLAGSLGLFGAMLLCYLGAMHLPSVMVAMIFGLSPLLTGVLGHAVFKTQRLVWIQWLGMLCGLFGMALAIGIWPSHTQTVSLLGVLYTTAGMACYVLSIFWLLHENAGLHPMVQTTGSLAMSAAGFVLLLPFFMAEMPTQLPSLSTMLAVLYTIVLASVVAMLCYFDLVERIGPTPVALTTILTPVLALCWGVLFNHERLGAHTVMGLLVVLCGMSLYFGREIQQTFPRFLGFLQKIVTHLRRGFR